MLLYHANPESNRMIIKNLEHLSLFRKSSDFEFIGKDIIKYKTSFFQAIPEISKGSCDACSIFDDTGLLCPIGDFCKDNDIIFVKGIKPDIAFPKMGLRVVRF